MGVVMIDIHVASYMYNMQAVLYLALFYIRHSFRKYIQ